MIWLDFLLLMGIVWAGVALHRWYARPATSLDSVRETAYEEGFSDAVRYFGLKKLYEEDRHLRERMEQVFGEAGIHHKISTFLNKQ